MTRRFHSSAILVLLTVFFSLQAKSEQSRPNASTLNFAPTRTEAHLKKARQALSDLNNLDSIVQELHTNSNGQQYHQWRSEQRSKECTLGSLCQYFRDQGTQAYLYSAPEDTTTGEGEDKTAITRTRGIPNLSMRFTRFGLEACLQNFLHSPQWTESVESPEFQHLREHVQNLRNERKTLHEFHQNLQDSDNSLETLNLIENEIELMTEEMTLEAYRTGQENQMLYNALDIFAQGETPKNPADQNPAIEPSLENLRQYRDHLINLENPESWQNALLTLGPQLREIISKADKRKRHIRLSGDERSQDIAYAALLKKRFPEVWNEQLSRLVSAKKHLTLTDFTLLVLENISAELLSPYDNFYAIIEDIQKTVNIDPTIVLTHQYLDEFAQNRNPREITNLPNIAPNNLDYNFYTPSGEVNHDVLKQYQDALTEYHRTMYQEIENRLLKKGSIHPRSNGENSFVRNLRTRLSSAEDSPSAFNQSGIDLWINEMNRNSMPDIQEQGREVLPPLHKEMREFILSYSQKDANKDPYLDPALFFPPLIQSDSEGNNSVVQQQQRYQEDLDRAERLFEEEKLKVISIIKRQQNSSNEENIQAMIRRIETTQFLPQTLDPSLYGQDPIQAYYSSLSHSITISSNMANWPEHSLRMIFAHELGHAVDPCIAASPFLSIKESFADSEDSPEIASNLPNDDIYVPNQHSSKGTKYAHNIRGLIDQSERDEINQELPGIPWSQNPFKKLLVCLEDELELEHLEKSSILKLIAQRIVSSMSEGSQNSLIDSAANLLMSSGISQMSILRPSFAELQLDIKSKDFEEFESAVQRSIDQANNDQSESLTGFDEKFDHLRGCSDIIENDVPGKTQEAFADWIASESIAMEAQKLEGPDEKVEAAFQSVALFAAASCQTDLNEEFYEKSYQIMMDLGCVQEENNHSEISGFIAQINALNDAQKFKENDSHLPVQRRVEEILWSQPQIREILGCESNNPHAYCEGKI